MQNTIENDLTALILAGGKSERMGKDKALIDYKGKPHIFYLADLLSLCTDKILISRNKVQLPLPNEHHNKNYEIIYDDDSTDNQGPLTGLISAVKKYPNANFLTVYCDIVNADSLLINKLIKGRYRGKYATCFTSDNFPEPSIVIFENKANEILFEKYRSEKYSIIKFLKEYDCKKISLTNDEKLIDKDS